MQPKISVVMATLNCEQTVAQAIRSCLTQTIKEIEVVVQDGGSVDNTLEEVGRLSDDRVRVASERDHGLYDAWNRAIPRTSGEWVTFLGADDYLLDVDALEKLTGSARLSEPRARILYGDVLVVDHCGGYRGRMGGTWSELQLDFLNGIMTLPHPGMLHHRSLFRDYGMFDEHYEIAGDFEFLLRVVRNEAPRYVPTVQAAAMRYGGLSARQDARWKSLRETGKALRKHGQIPHPHVRGPALARAALVTLLARVVPEETRERLRGYTRRGG